MVFERKGNPVFVINKVNLNKMKSFYLILVCLVANFLSSIALELVGTRSPHTAVASGQTATISTMKDAVPKFLHHHYNLKVKLFLSNMVSGLISTILVALGKRLNVPYLFVPWLVNTMRGIVFCEGPTLVSLAYKILPESDVTSRSFLLLTFILYVEELCLWKEIFHSFCRSWIEYSDCMKKNYRLENTKDNGNISQSENLPSTSHISNDETGENDRSCSYHYSNNNENISNTLKLLNKLRCRNRNVRNNFT